MSIGMNRSKASYFTKILQDLTGRNNFDNERLNPLLEQMEIMSHLMEDFVSAQTEEEVTGIGLRIRACQKESGTMITDFLSQYGVSSESVLEYFSNPNHLSKQEWEIIQGLQQKLLRLEEQPSPAALPSRKKNGRKGREKI